MMGDSRLENPLCPHVYQFRSVFRKFYKFRNLKQLLEVGLGRHALRKGQLDLVFAQLFQRSLSLSVRDRFEASIEDKRDC